MSNQLSTIQIIEFDAQVKAAYQGAGLLRKAVRTKNNVQAGQVKFRRYNRGVASRRVPQTDVVTMGQGYAEVTATVTDWNAADYTDVFDQSKTNIEERPIIAKNAAMAIERREDQIIINALDAALNSHTIVHGGTSMTTAKIRRINRYFDQRSVPRQDRYLVISAGGKEDLLSENILIDDRYVPRGAVTNGELPAGVFGLNIIVMDERDEGGLPTSTTTISSVDYALRTCYAFDKQAIGYAIGLDQRVAVDWVPQKTSWLVNQMFSAGAVCIDPLGVIQVETVELPLS